MASNKRIRLRFLLYTIGIGLGLVLRLLVFQRKTICRHRPVKLGHGTERYTNINDYWVPTYFQVAQLRRPFTDAKGKRRRRDTSTYT